MAKNKERFKINPQPKNGIVITKIDAARRQLETALNLWFHDGDYVSIHTLAFSAYEILHPLAKKKGTFEGIFNSIYIVPGHEEEYKASFRAFHTFFKHGSSDANQTIKFDPKSNDHQLELVIRVYNGVTGETSPIMDAYEAYFVLAHPNCCKIDPYPTVSAEVRKGVLSESKAEYLDLYFQHHRMRR